MHDINIRVGQSDTYYLEGVIECEQSVSGKDIRRVGKERGKSNSRKDIRRVGKSVTWY